MEQQPNSIWIRAYTPSGFQISITMPIGASIISAAALDNELLTAGYLTQPPGIEPGEQSEVITTVVRREHVDKRGQATPVIDCYPDWRGDYGQYRFCGIYLNTAEDIAEFEAQSGLKLTEMPLYESQAPLQRNAARPHKSEAAVKSPFTVVKTSDGEKEIDGKTQKVYKFTRYGKPAQTAAKTELGADSNRRVNTGSNVPASNGGKDAMDARLNGTKEEAPPEPEKVVLKMLQVKLIDGKKRLYFTADNGKEPLAFSRKLFQKKLWCDENEWLEPKTITLNPPIPATIISRGNYYEVIDVERNDPFADDADIAGVLLPASNPLDEYFPREDGAA